MLPVLAWLTRRNRQLAALLVLSLLPMLSYFGHWQFSVPIPGTDLAVGIPAGDGHHAEGHSHPGHDEDAASHAAHCHAGPASCVDAPVAGIAAFAQLMEASLLVTAAGVLVLVLLDSERRPAGAPVSPDLRPPRRAGLAPP
jgi:hypothetical protein